MTLTLATTAAGRIDPRSTLGNLLRDSSLEMNARDIDKLEEAAHLILPGTQISITFLPNEDFADRVRAAATVRRLGFLPTPHISARRMKSASEFESFLADLASEAELDRVFVVAGDPPRSEGPYEDALAVIRTGLLGKYGVTHVGVAGYPEGHPDIPRPKLWQALHDKQAVLKDLGHAVSIMTQFGFDADPILDWLAQLRRDGVQAPVRVGVAGPTSVKALLRFAARCGVGTSAKVMAKYGMSITRLLSTAGPDPIVNDMALGLDPDIHGQVLLHLYPFGGFLKTAEWAPAFRRSHGI
ncbi:MAG TPA: methylenetetrahydrofolate reductase [Caulobacteraceae bacterium]